MNLRRRSSSNHAKGALAMFKTKNDLPEATRVKVVELLNARLADWFVEAHLQAER
jgi:hypothetical protein